MSSNNRNRRWAGGLGAAAGGLLAAAFLPMAIANADEYVYTDFGFVPDPSTEWGIPGLISGATGSTHLDTFDLTTHTDVLDSLSGQDTETNILNSSTSHVSFSNDLFTVSSDISDPSGLAPGSVIDISNISFGLLGMGPGVLITNFGNELVDAAAGSTTPGITDILFTPTGDFVLF